MPENQSTKKVPNGIVWYRITVQLCQNGIFSFIFYSKAKWHFILYFKWGFFVEQIIWTWIEFYGILWKQKTAWKFHVMTRKKLSIWCNHKLLFDEIITKLYSLIRRCISMVRCNTARAGNPECKVDRPQLNGSRGSLGTIENPYDLVE